MPKISEEIQINSSLCKTIYQYPELGSTNNLAREFIEKDKKMGFSIVAKTQTAGQGSGGRFWESPFGGLWSSLAVQPQINLHQLGIVPILTSIGIAKALETFNIPIMLKWPNDLLFQNNRKKIGGILVEGKVTQFTLHYLIIGFGINVNNKRDQFSAVLRKKVTSTLIETDTKLDLIDLLKSIINQIEKQFEILKSKGVITIIEEWKQHPNILGMDVIITNKDEKVRGKVIDISRFGQLILNTQNNEEMTFSTGTVTLLDNDD